MRHLSHVERLEDRDVPVVFGQPWADARHLTLSLVPDGTRIGAAPSDLFATLGAARPDGAWQDALFRAVQKWSSVANLSMGLVADGGQDFGAPGLGEGDARFGDIRVGARPLAPSVLAVAVPPDAYLSGTWAGDIVVNSAIDWTDPRNDLAGVFLHEVGHALGLDENDDPTSVMCRDLSLAPSELSPSDASAIALLYGLRPADPNELVTSNDSQEAATPLPAGSTRTPWVEYGDITTPADTDYFSLQVPATVTGALNVDVVTRGISLLAPRVTVLDSNGAVVASSESQVPGGDRVTVPVPQVQAGATYYVKVEAGAGDYGVGRYGLGVTFSARTRFSDANLISLLTGPYDTWSADRLSDLLENFGGGSGAVADHSTLRRAIELRTTSGFASHTHYAATGHLTDATTAIVYKFDTPRRVSGQPLVMTAAVTSTLPAGTVPNVVAMTSTGQTVPVDVIATGGGRLTVQAIGLDPSTTYYLKVSSPTPATGDFRLVVDFTQPAALAVTYADTSVAPGADLTGSLYVAQPQLFHLVLTTASAPDQPGAAVRVAILDADGNTVWDATAEAGGAISTSGLLLGPGEYRVTVSAVGATGALAFRLRGATLGDPVGPLIDDPTATPLYKSPNKPGWYTYPNGVTTKVSFLWSWWGI